MALNKVNYVDNQTVITAQNLNNIQNEIIQNTELIKKVAPRNLLDNSDFTNPVNQRGNTTTTDFAYFIDRWTTRENGNCISLVSNGLKIDASSLGSNVLTRQGIANLRNGTYTVAAYNADGTPMGLRTYEVTGETVTQKASLLNSDIYVGLIYVNGCYWVEMTARAYKTATFGMCALYEGEYTAETLPEYQPKGYMVEALNCGALHVTTTATLNEGQWSNSAPFEQSIVIPGIIESDVPHITPVYSTTNTTAIAQKEAWACVSNAIAENGVIRFICFEDKPTTTIPIQIEVNR